LNALRSPDLAPATLILVTHKPSMLSVVNRVLVMSKGQIVLDGPRDAVLAHLSKNAQTEPAKTAASGGAVGVSS
jgi:ATP-binding cassette subfamily C protein LapB